MMNQNRSDQKAMRRYNRIARFYDPMMVLSELAFSRWRRMLWQRAEGQRVLEVGVGTGRNFPFYPSQAPVVAIDFSQGMLQRGKARADKEKRPVNLILMDIQHLAFKDSVFDSVVGSFVFCSVPDPVAGLIEAGRVCRDGGKVVLLEHVRSKNKVMGWLMDRLNPLMVRLGGENINRRTEDNVIASGLRLKQVTNLRAGIFKLIEAQKPQAAEAM